MVIDVHIHTITGIENSSLMLKAMDRDGVDIATVFSTSPQGYRTCLNCPELEPEECMVRLQKFCAGHENRLVPFFWVDPVHPRAKEQVIRAHEKYRVKGLKIIPFNFDPYDERAFPVYAEAEKRGMPVLFHSGIFFGAGDSSRHCRPANYEILNSFPKLKFALAHISWPWTDECIALAGRFLWGIGRKREEQSQMFIDITPGTPPIYREDALRKALLYNGVENMLMFGTDSIAGETYEAKGNLLFDRALLRILGIREEVQEKIFSQNAKRFLGL